MADVACKMAPAAILDFEPNVVTFEPFNRSSPNLMWMFKSLFIKIDLRSKQDGGDHLGCAD
jgi:hypothetical protein